jgi:predicted ArsR family transcriptional regulator
MTRKDKLIGLAQAAEEFGLNHNTLRRHVNDGLLKAQKIAGVWLVTRAEIERYLEESKPQMGRPPKDKE